MPVPDGAVTTRSKSAVAKALLTKAIGSRVVKYGFLAVAIAFGVYAVITQWTDIHHDVDRIGLRWSLAALAFVLAALFTSMLSWRALLIGLGSPLPVATSARIFFIGQLGKYVPGSVWPVLAQMEIATAHKVPRHRTALASVLTMLIALLTGLIIGAVTLPFTGGSTPYAWAFIAVPFLVACLYPKVLNWGFARLLRLARRPPLEQPISARAIGTSLGWSFVSWTCYGLQLWVLVFRVGGDARTALPLAIGAFAFAWCAGFLVILAPAGAGVREAVLVGILGTAVGTGGSAFAVALVSRAVTLAADVITAAAAAIYYRRDKKKATAAGPAAVSPDPASTANAASAR